MSGCELGHAMAMLVDIIPGLGFPIAATRQPYIPSLQHGHLVSSVKFLQLWAAHPGSLRFAVVGHENLFY